MVVVVFVFISEGENNDEQICQTTEVEILPSIDFCKFQWNSICPILNAKAMQLSLDGKVGIVSKLEC